MDKLSRVAVPSIGVDVISRFTLLKNGRMGLALQTGGMFVYDTLTDDYGFTNNLLFTGPLIGISYGLEMPFLDGFSLWIAVSGGYGYSEVIDIEPDAKTIHGIPSV